MRLKTILNLLAKKYPTDYKNDMNPVIVMYNDESGRIVKDALVDLYYSGNCLFSFDSIDELVSHLKGESNVDTESNNSNS